MVGSWRRSSLLGALALLTAGLFLFQFREPATAYFPTLPARYSLLSAPSSLPIAASSSPPIPPQAPSSFPLPPTSSSSPPPPQTPSFSPSGLSFPPSSPRPRPPTLLPTNNHDKASAAFTRRQYLWNQNNSSYLCSSSASSSSQVRVAWVTATINDDYVVPAVALAHSIHKFSCLHPNKDMLAIVGPDVSPSSREVLSKVGFRLIEKPPIDCLHEGQNTGDSRLKAIKGSHTRLHYWDMTEHGYERFIYVDCDLILLDEQADSLLFDLPLSSSEEIYAAKFSATSKIALNSGLLVFRPDKKVFQGLLKLWRDHFEGENGEGDCWYDQKLITKYFSGRTHFLPFDYNVRRKAHYPMHVYHMAGTEEHKAWLHPVRREKATDRPIRSVPRDVNAVWWFMFYDALDTYGLNEWWKHKSSTTTRLLYNGVTPFCYECK
ncbi:hypothetical protein QOT17_008222 [Balamuthia mandrillaris]